MLTAKFGYNKVKKTSTNEIFFKLKYGSHYAFFLEDKTGLYLISHSANLVANKFEEKIMIFQQNLIYAQKMQKKLIIRASSLTTMHLIKKSDLIANTS